MQQLGNRLGKAARGGEVLYITGDLGAGKTTLTQAIAKGMAVSTVVTSPTFVIVQEYPGAESKMLIHADLYRVHAEEELHTTGLFDTFGATDSVVVVEWPERISSLERYPHLHIVISGMDDEKRHIGISLHGQSEANERLYQEFHHA